MTAWTVCLDFGTAYSKAAAAPADAWAHFQPGMVRPLMLGAHETQGNPFLLDSAIFVDERNVLFGRAAIKRADAMAEKKRMALKSFKTLLSVSDLDRALATNAPLSIDPHRIFQMRDLIVLYLAYLLEATAQACAADPEVAAATQLHYRYAAPAWRSGDSAGMHGVIVQLFGEAEAFRALAGEKLLSSDGVAIGAISTALPKATANARPLEMGLIFEATAAAAYTSVGIDDSGSHMIVVDMGAGTTDIAALARVGSRAVEIPEARVTLKQAGDFIDRVIANSVLEQAKWARSREDKADLWNVLMRQMRDIKESIFEDGRATLRHRGKNISLALRDIERDPDFKIFYKSLSDAFAHGLTAVRGDAVMRGRSEVQAIAVGGGAAAPFIQTLLKKKTTRTKPRVVVRPATPDWAHAREFEGNLAPVFPQLAISLGGAIAPDGMLAARGSVSPVSVVQSDIEAERG